MGNNQGQALGQSCNNKAQADCSSSEYLAHDPKVFESCLKLVDSMMKGVASVITKWHTSGTRYIQLLFCDCDMFVVFHILPHVQCCMSNFHQ